MSFYLKIKADKWNSLSQHGDKTDIITCAVSRGGFSGTAAGQKHEQDDGER